MSNSPVAKSSYTSFQQQLIKAAENFETEKENMRELSGKFGLFGSYNNHPYIDPLNLNNLFREYKNNYGHYFLYPTDRNKFFQDNILRFTEYSAYPQRIDQIYEFFALLNCRTACQDLVIAPLPVELQDNIRDFLGTPQQEYLSNPEWIKFHAQNSDKSTKETESSSPVNTSIQQSTVNNGSLDEDESSSSSSSSTNTTRSSIEQKPVNYDDLVNGISDFASKKESGVGDFPELVPALTDYFVSSLPPKETFLLKVKLAALETNFKKNMETAKAKHVRPIVQLSGSINANNNNNNSSTS